MEDVIPQLCGVSLNDGESGAEIGSASAGPVIKDGIIVFPAEVQVAIDQVCIWCILNLSLFSSNYY